MGKNLSSRSLPIIRATICVGGEIASTLKQILAWCTASEAVKTAAFHFSIGVVIIDDHPEVTVVEDSQSNLNDDGFTEVVSKKQQKRLQDEERRKKEEQTVQVQTNIYNRNEFLAVLRML